MRLNTLLKLIVAVGISELAGIIGSSFTVPAISGWYEGLVKPALDPPSWVFGPVWVMLYALVGIAAFLVWRQGWEKEEVRDALSVFGMQLVLNAVWSVIFFGLRSPGWAFFDLIALWLVILWTMILFHRISRSATYLLLPYILWVSFAGYLNFMIWILNIGAQLLVQ